MARRRPALARVAGALALLAALLVLSGCGEDEGAAAGATVDAYFAASLCPPARAELARSDGRAGELRVRAICLDEVGADDRLDLATVGANARRASEDSAAVAYVEPRSPANRFAQPIVEEAAIAFLYASSGAAAAQRVLRAVEEAGSGPLRDEVRKTLEAE